MTNQTEKLSKQELCPDVLLAGQEKAFLADIERIKARSDEFVSVTCPACGSRQGVDAFEKFTLKYLSCSSCETLYISPRPSPQVMMDYYRHSENYRYWAEHIFPASESARREKINRPWLERIINICERFDVPRSHLVEIGPGFGTFAALVNAEGAFARVTGIEPTPEMAQACRDRGVEVLEIGVEDIEDNRIAADVVVAFEVIEHLFEPLTFFAKAKSLLKPGGLLIVSCPNGLGFEIATLGPTSLAVDVEHVNLFNPSSLRRLAARVGFRGLEVLTPGRLDAELVRSAVLAGRHQLRAQSFSQIVLLERWAELGWPFQTFLAENGLSSHMFGVFQNPREAPVSREHSQA